MKKSLLILLAFAGALIIFLFTRYKETLPFPAAFQVLGGLMIIAALFILIFGPFLKREAETDKVNEYGQYLKQHGEHITFNLSACSIKENHYVEERDRYDENELLFSSYKSDIMALDALYDETRNTERVKVEQSVLVYKHTHNGRTETFYSPIIPKDRVTLMFLMENKKGNIYVNKVNRSDYYFDLDFLEGHFS